ncbi:hypothetical protein P879_04485 [Paragonimus westermani]|uniref:Transmembrane protein n=1 Tax=Paragonimus westermani TaxID=34504 RepID=A0A8T0D7W5_9TREM|nr:hypothetical protein P879_04485 [Paragonimus westermani]
MVSLELVRIFHVISTYPQVRLSLFVRCSFSHTITKNCRHHRTNFVKFGCFFPHFVLDFLAIYFIKLIILIVLLFTHFQYKPPLTVKAPPSHPECHRNFPAASNVMHTQPPHQNFSDRRPPSHTTYEMPGVVEENDMIANDCCLNSADPLVHGPGRTDCVVATIFFVIFVLLILCGTITSVLHYVAGIEFSTTNRGRVVGPVLLGLSIIPLLFVILFICRAKDQVASQVEQLKLTHSAREKIAYRQHQAQLARESTLYSGTSYSSHRPFVV